MGLGGCGWGAGVPWAGVVLPWWTGVRGGGQCFWVGKFVLLYPERMVPELHLVCVGKTRNLHARCFCFRTNNLRKY